MQSTVQVTAGCTMHEYWVEDRWATYLLENFGCAGQEAATDVCYGDSVCFWSSWSCTASSAPCSVILCRSNPKFGTYVLLELCGLASETILNLLELFLPVGLYDCVDKGCGVLLDVAQDRSTKTPQGERPASRTAHMQKRQTFARCCVA